MTNRVSFVHYIQAMVPMSKKRERLDSWNNLGQIVRACLCHKREFREVSGFFIWTWQRGGRCQGFEIIEYNGFEYLFARQRRLL